MLMVKTNNTVHPGYASYSRGTETAEVEGLCLVKTLTLVLKQSTLNQNIGKYKLNHIWDRVLFNTPGLNWALPHYTVLRLALGQRNVT